MFVLWERARIAETRILEDLATRAEILVSFVAGWPEGMKPADGFRRFYGRLLPDSDEKARRAGGGAFRVVIARFRDPAMDWRWTRRGLEYMNVEVQELKDRYRGWVGGENRVHGTLTSGEAAHDILMMTGHTVREWASGRLAEKDARVLPGHGGWKSLADMFAFLNEAHPYVVLRNGEGLPGDFDPVHEDIDFLATDAVEFTGLVGARKVARAGVAAYTVRVAGKDVKIDVREIGDGYYDERWERGILARRVLGEKGVYLPGVEDRYLSLAYHVLFQKPRIAGDYYAKLARLGLEAGGTGTSPNDWFDDLALWMHDNDYAFTKPKDLSVRPRMALAGWRDVADEAAAIFGAVDLRPDFPSYLPLEFRGRMDGGDIRLRHSRGAVEATRRAYELARKVFLVDGRTVAEPLRWHSGSKGAYLVYRDNGSRSLAEVLDRGERFAPAIEARIGESAIALIAALEKAGVVHRDIRPETLRVAPDGSLSLDSFACAVDRRSYKVEPTFLRRDPARLLVPLGGEGVARPGEWNDRHALAASLKGIATSTALREVIERLESEAASGMGTLRMNPRKLRLRLIGLYLEVLFRGILSARRRRSAMFRRIRAFVVRSLF